MANQNQSVPVTAPVKNPHNVQATKYYVFNETGNIMMSSTTDSSSPITQDVQKLFSEVSVFFAGMSRAITTTINPATKQHYSLYNYEALERVISGSGLFVHVTEEDMSYKTSQFGVNFSKELLEALLGLATGAGALSFASAMVSSIGNEGVNISGQSNSSNSKVGNIIFVCEYLLGMPVISALVFSMDASTHKQQFKLGPCFQESSTKTEWKIHKDTYMFVTPNFIQNFAGDLDSINSNADYLEMINWFSGLLSQTPTINQIVDTATNTPVETGAVLNSTTTYKILGQYLGDKGSLKFTNGTATIITGTWSTDGILFKVTGTDDTPSSIEVQNSNKKVLATSTQLYTVAK